MLKTMQMALVVGSTLSGCSLLFETSGPTASDAGLGSGVDARVDSPDARNEDWDDVGFGRRIRFSVTNPVNDELLGFPVLVEVTLDELGGPELPGLGELALFFEGNGIPIDVDVGPADAGTRIRFWFSANLSTGETHEYRLYFGTESGNPDRSAEAWPSHDRVWHMGEETGAYANSTSATSDGAGNRSTSGTPVAGRFGGGVGSSLANTDPVMTTFDPIASAARDCVSITGWVKPNQEVASAEQQTQYLASTIQSLSDKGYRLSYRDRMGATPTITLSVFDSGQVSAPITETSPLDNNEWSWLGMSLFEGAAGAALQLYVNGNPAGSSAGLVQKPVYSEGLTLAVGGFLNASMDELRISTACRSEAWMFAEYQAMTEPFLPVFRDVEERP